MEHARVRLSFVAGVLALGAAVASAQGDEAGVRGLWVYPAPGQEEYRSEHYRVSVAHDGEPTEVFCHRSRSIWHHEFPGDWAARYFPIDNNWVTFSFTGKVTVTVEPLGVTATGVEVRPDREGVSASLHDGRAVVEISRPGQYYVLVKADGAQHEFDHPLFLFANPPETDVPTEGSPGVHYFGPGVHDIGFQYRVGAGETVYLAGGALVRGSLYYQGDGVRILGRGILTDRALMLERVESALAERAAGNPNPWDLNHDRMYRDNWATIYGDADADSTARPASVRRETRRPLDPSGSRVVPTRADPGDDSTARPASVRRETRRPPNPSGSRVVPTRADPGDDSTARPASVRRETRRPPNPSGSRGVPTRADPGDDSEGPTRFRARHDAPPTQPFG